MTAFPQFSLNTTAEEVAIAFSHEIKGKNVLITGTSLNGIGFETARVIAKHANLVIITGYNDERLRLSENTIKKDIHTADIRRLTLDFSSLTAVRKAAAEVNTYSEPIHVDANLFRVILFGSPGAAYEFSTPFQLREFTGQDFGV
ncbi:hypothetical protein B0H19DRAFT_1250680 [Mycena capillaripes]|nr:hypothetical protein B0H19DRAFT_1250680 [Mycena capillaripes]